MFFKEHLLKYLEMKCHNVSTNFSRVSNKTTHTHTHAYAHTHTRTHTDKLIQ